MIGTLKDQRSMLKELWVSRKGQLEQRFQFNLFKQDAEKVWSPLTVTDDISEKFPLEDRHRFKFRQSLKG